MITRRKLLRSAAAGLVCAPSIVHAQGFWMGQVGGPAVAPKIMGSQFLASNMTQVKPQGLPQINWDHPLTNGLLVDMLDMGNGEYVNLCEGNGVLNISYGSASTAGTPQALVNGSTKYGTATLWPGLTVQGAFAQPGVAAMIQVNLGDLSIFHANDLATKGIGAGNTIACGCMRLPGNINANYCWIFGRLGTSAGEVSPDYEWGFVNFGNELNVAAMCLTTGGTQAQMGTDYILVPYQYTTLLATCQNTSASPGTGTARFAVNGVTNGTTAGVSMNSYDPATHAETDLQIGCTKHLMTSETVNLFGGYIYWGRVWTRSLTTSEWMYLHNHPYSIYL